MQVSIVGITGYSGLELLRLIHQHPHVELASVYANKEAGQELAAIYPHLKGIYDLKVEEFNSQKIIAESDLVFFATPSGVAKDLVADFVAADFPVTDLSGDHRLLAHQYEKWYHKDAAQPAIQKEFIYSLAEFSNLDGKKFISNPGCYATATELALIPLVEAGIVDLDNIIVDAKSGLTGAGKGLTESSHFVNVYENYATYKLNQHQHIPEIVQTLKGFQPDLEQIQFSTSLLPVSRGIVMTAYLQVKEGVDEEQIAQLYHQAYDSKPFVRIQKDLPDLHQVLYSNYTDIGFSYNKKTHTLTVMAVLDNLVKGAAGQAIQNLNLLCGFEETAGLLMVPAFV